MTKAKPKPKIDLPNIHPADELAAIREEIKILTGRADELRDMLLAEGADLSGDHVYRQHRPRRARDAGPQSHHRSLRRGGDRAVRQENQLQNRQTDREMK